MRDEGFLMIIEGFIWLSDIVDKIESKHGVAVHEALVILARDMTDGERKYYAKRKK